MTSPTRCLEGQVALVTGAGRGIGRAIAEALARAGAAVAVLARTEGQVRETADRIATHGVRASAVVADVRDPAQVQQAVHAVFSELGPVDLLVNNAGAAFAVGPVWEVDADEWWSIVETNLRGPFLFARAVLPTMIERHAGRIVNLASQASIRPYAYNTAYACSKAAVVRFTDSLADETRDHGIQVFALSPGSVRTTLTDEVHESPAGKRWLGDDLSKLTFVPPDLAADAVTFIATGGADALSGRFFHVSDDVRALAARGAEIAHRDLYQLRWRTGVPDE
jgi:3-oxoacyl-[acyl-carrier protein] reductase